MEKPATPTRFPSSQLADKTSQVGARMHAVTRSIMSLERRMKRDREELYMLAAELRTGRAELEQFEEVVEEYARVVEADLERRDAADKIRASAGGLKKSQDIMEEAARLVDQALAKIENRRVDKEESAVSVLGP